MHKRLEALTTLVKSGGFDHKTIDEIAFILSNSDDSSVKRHCIYMLGRAGAIKYEGLIKSFLEDKINLTVSESALVALVTGLKKADICLEKLKEFLCENEGDEFDEGLRGARLTALQLAGDAYRQTGDIDLLEAIINNLNNDSEVFRESAQKSLIRAMINNIEILTPMERRQMELNADIDELRTQAEIIAAESKFSI